MAKYKIKLFDNQIDVLKNMPEQGMGYQIVNIVLKNGNVLKRKIIINSMYLQLDDNEKIDPNEISKIELNKD